MSFFKLFNLCLTNMLNKNKVIVFNFMLMTCFPLYSCGKNKQLNLIESLIKKITFCQLFRENGQVASCNLQLICIYQSKNIWIVIL